MDYRHFVRILLMYDLPMSSSFDQRNYNRFHNMITRKGYDMINFSVYVKTCKNMFECNKQISLIKRTAPQYGNIRILKLTNKQYEQMMIIRGEQTYFEKTLSNNKLVIIDE